MRMRETGSIRSKSPAGISSRPPKNAPGTEGSSTGRISSLLVSPALRKKPLVIEAASGCSPTKLYSDFSSVRHFLLTLECCSFIISPNDEIAETAHIVRKTIQTFKALSDPNRIRILKMLEVRSLCVCVKSRKFWIWPHRRCPNTSPSSGIPGLLWMKKTANG